MIRVEVNPDVPSECECKIGICNIKNTNLSVEAIVFGETKISRGTSDVFESHWLGWKFDLTCKANRKLPILLSN